MPSVFVSYAREDLKGITRLLEGLSKNGISAWRDEDDHRGGQNWPEVFGDAMGQEDGGIGLSNGPSHGLRRQHRAPVRSQRSRRPTAQTPKG